MARLLRLMDEQDGMKALVRWKGLPNSEDTLEPLARVYEYVPEMLLRLILRKTTSIALDDKTLRILSL